VGGGGEGWKKDVEQYADEMKQIWEVSVLVDSPNVHPSFITGEPVAC